MNWTWRATPAAILLCICALQAVAAEEHAVVPYIDPTQLDCPWPKHSFYKQPWRGYLETRSGDEFVRGVGINYNVPDGKLDDLAVRLLAEAGFRAFRIEIGWGSVNWEETQINGAERYLHLLQLCKKYEIRPTVLLNGNSGVPCPVKFFEKTLAADAPAGARSIRLTDVSGLVPGYSGLDQLTEYWAGEALITAVDAISGDCTLSKPLPHALVRDKPVGMCTLKVLPLYPVGTGEFEATAASWLRYAKLVTDLAAAAGIEQYDLEIWNELSFGSRFVEARNYYDPVPFKTPPHFLHPGGAAWELAQRTVRAVHATNPAVTVIWGFSNTTFFDCAIKDLPDGINAQSYHPYGTGTREFPEAEQIKDHPEFNLEGYRPKLTIRLPEGFAQEFIQTECLIRLINPMARQTDHPPGVEPGSFLHYMTEHGITPEEVGIKDDDGCWRIKAQCALRANCFWLNKGMHRLEYYCAFDEKPQGMGLLPPNLTKLKPDARFDDVATVPMKAMRQLAQAFTGAVALKTSLPLKVELTELGNSMKIFDGDASHPPLSQRDAIAVLPWQVTEHKVVIAIYAMTYDATQKMADANYRLRVFGLPVQATEVQYLEPMSGKAAVATLLATRAGGQSWELPVSDTPRLLILAW